MSKGHDPQTTAREIIMRAISGCRTDLVAQGYAPMSRSVERGLEDAGFMLPDLPPHWHIAKIEVRRDRAWTYRQGELTYDALLERDGGDYEATGSGPTPAAAVRAAMKEIG